MVDKNLLDDPHVKTNLLFQVSAMFHSFLLNYFLSDGWTWCNSSQTKIAAFFALILTLLGG